MENNEKAFLRILIIILISFVALLVLFGAAYVNASLNVYSAILIVLIISVGFCIGALAVMSAAIFRTFKTKKASGLTLALTKLGLRVLMPVAVLFTKSNSKEKKSIRYFYIELNNIVVESNNKKYNPNEIMILVPHCLQNSLCGLKVTSNPELCRQCGRCKIGMLLKYTKEKGIKLFVATGGTVARNIVKKTKPEIIISVACERDLMSGISDIKGIPVIGIINKQPNGPCVNTDVDVERLIEKIRQITVDAA
ncbi:protein of unknown function DUF116 [Ruminiclostridium cellulolyticum H10]|uniref:DUF116 domain-containing protein n=1 Tax=Ruminiclostridium cellulolyticum (strain ATCC 35319 / DSM 5812 / JCM 6584 / H10) TaxID=394503 RepID=B8I256_RUMCH|nr:protein of unknown function DUF116 [Ruminiclostridium cellulolyticum H10]